MRLDARSPGGSRRKEVKVDCPDRLHPKIDDRNAADELKAPSYREQRDSHRKQENRSHGWLSIAECIRDDRQLCRADSSTLYSPPASGTRCDRDDIGLAALGEGQLCACSGCDFSEAQIASATESCPVSIGERVGRSRFAAKDNLLTLHQDDIDLLAPAPIDFCEDLMGPRSHFDGLGLTRAQAPDHLIVDHDLKRIKALRVSPGNPLHFDQCSCHNYCVCSSPSERTTVRGRPVGPIFYDLCYETRLAPQPTAMDRPNANLAPGTGLAAIGASATPTSAAPFAQAAICIL